MVGWIRTVLVWLLVLALPAQGVAAATMVLCNPNHHATAPDQAPHTHSHAAQQGLDDEGQPARRASADIGPDAVGAAGDLSATKLVHADGQKCSACASCCSAAVIGSTVLNVPAPGVTPAVFTEVVPAVEKFSSDGPDRPPRALFV